MDPSSLAGGSSSTSSSLLGGLEQHQTFLLVAVLVVVHIGGIALVLACMWNQSPKDVHLKRRFLDEQRGEIKRSISKND